MVLHWRLSDLDDMDWDEIVAWHDEALKRFKVTAQLHGAEVK